MRNRQIFQQMMQSVAQRASRNRVRHMMQQQEPLPEYPEDDGPLTNSQIEQIKDSVRTKYA
jgi:hypothetical protein